ETAQPLPTTVGEIASCVYHSLAQSYREAVTELEDLIGLPIKTIHIVGGGSQADYLNDLTARYTGKQVIVGPVEATALGNILSQMLKAGDFSTLEEARYAVLNSFPITKW
ncbi:MAG TPA: rhamnulokinase, partial [Firmicutes bacterium]|nr:rhamnulokinase [Bacillota bacterium]